MWRGDARCSGVNGPDRPGRSRPGLADGGEALLRPVTRQRLRSAVVGPVSAGPAGRLSAAMRRLEVRIGQLLPKAAPTPGPGRGKASVMDDGLSRDQRHEFRQMASAPEIVEQVITESTDEAPASGPACWNPGRRSPWTSVAPVTARMGRDGFRPVLRLSGAFR